MQLWACLAPLWCTVGLVIARGGGEQSSKQGQRGATAPAASLSGRRHASPRRRMHHHRRLDESAGNDTCALDNSYRVKVMDKILSCEDPDFRPVQEDSSTIEVRVNIEFFHIDSVSETDGTITFNVWFRSFWTDELMTWDVDQYGGVEFVTVNRDEMWIPDIVVFNTATLPVEFTPTKPWVYSDGYVWDSVPALMQVTCNFDFKYFPYDKQKCYIRLGSWIYSGLEMDLNVASEEIDGMQPFDVNDNFYDSTTFKVVDVEWTRNVEYYNTEPWPEIVYTITIQRHAVVWYVSNSIIPMTFASIVTFGSFWLDPVSQGERVGLCITALLTITAVHLTVTEGVPKSKYHTWLDRYTMGCFCFAFSATLMTLAVIYLAHKKDRELGKNWLIRCLRGLSNFANVESKVRKHRGHKSNSRQPSNMSLEVRTDRIELTDTSPTTVSSRPVGTMNSRSNTDNATTTTGASSPPPVVVPAHGGDDLVGVGVVRELSLSVAAGDSAHEFRNPMTAHYHGHNGSTGSLQPPPLHLNNQESTSSIYSELDEAAGRQAGRQHRSFYTWKNIAHALDRICRVFYPIGFVLFVSIMFNDLYHQDGD